MHWLAGCAVYISVSVLQRICKAWCPAIMQALDVTRSNKSFCSIYAIMVQLS